MSNSPETNAFGRRNYDVEITRLESKVENLQNEVKELRLDIKDMVDAWKSAKGLTSFVKWISGILLAVGAIIAAAKGWKI